MNLSSEKLVSNVAFKFNLYRYKEVDPRAEARAEGERAFAAGMAIGQIIVTAGYSGEIRIFENVGSPCWL